MNLSTPIIICDENEDIRLLLKEMLTRYGYFHLVEASSSEEVLQLIVKEQFILIHKNLINEKIKSILSHREKFLIIAQADSADTVNLSANFGVKRLISFPYTSKSLVEKINELLA
jgi:response regulator RpfG family c-di-GMP phosphodiesterase